jgi:amino acid adenylation domain-containing protein
MEMLPPITRARRHELLPLSLAQQRLWFLAQLEQVSQAYHLPFGLRLRGALDGAALRRALDRIVARHEALRTRFIYSDGQPVQRIAAKDAGFDLREHDLRRHADPEGELRRLAVEEAEATFDLQKGPLARGQLVRLNDEEHVLLATLHHIVSDSWSIGVLTRELSALYAAFRDGLADPLPPLAIQYPDYAVWQRRWLLQERQSVVGEYWRRELKEAPTVLELPTDRSRPTQQNYAGAFIPLELDERLTLALGALSRRHGTKPFATLLAGWAALLSRLSGQDDVVIGTAVANRGRVETEPLIGLFANSLALRLDLSGGPGVGDLLEQAKARVLAAQRHQDLPFEQVVEVINPPRTLAHQPVFQVMFAWDGDKPGTPHLPGLIAAPFETPCSAAKFDLTLKLKEAHGRIVGGLEYATALFDHATVERHAGYLLRLLKGMTVDDARAVDRLPLLGETERSQLLAGWNATGVDYPLDKCAHELFEAQVARTPQAIAVTREDKQLTYEELRARADRLAQHLQTLGVRPDDRVAICVERSFEMVVGLLAILKAGGAYVPLDPGYPGERLAYMLRDCAPSVVLTHRPARAALDSAVARLAQPPPVLDLDGDAATLVRQHAANPKPSSFGLTPRHLAYIIYTSGSTGQPKGVMVEHRGLCNYLCWAIESYAPSKNSIVSSSLSFDATITSLYLPLLVGGTVRLLSSNREIDGLNELVGEVQDCDLVKITPSHLDLLGQCVVSRGSSTSIETVVIGGEALSHSTVQQWRGIQTNIRLINEYGPTETVVGCIFYDIPGEFDRSLPIPVGRPIANTRIYLLDRHRQPVPTGVIGEIYIGGAGVARGYLNRPELTAERFIASPFVEGDRLYRTGDLGRYRANGTIEYLGRNDLQVKIRGHRIELGEIEARLAQHPAVREAAALAREVTPLDKRLVAYYTVVANAEAPSAATLRAHLAGVLPDYMLPAAYVPLAALPLTANGKLDRKTLPLPDADAHAACGHAPPQGETERALARIFAEALGIERVGRHDDFFEFGGDSLLGVQCMLNIEAAFERKLPVGALFLTPTIAGLADSLNQSWAERSISVVPLHTHGDGAAIFMVHWIERDLGRHLGRRRPVYGLCFGLGAATGSADALVLPDRIETLASHYIEEMRSVQPYGPYYLIGHSMGGLIAFEMAQQLIARGETVALVGLLDTYLPDLERRRRRLSLVQVCRNLLRTPRRTLLNFAALRIADKIESIPLARRAMDRLLPTPAASLRRLKDIVRIHYEPAPYPGPVHLFQSTTPGTYIRTEPPPPPEVGWRGLALGGLNVHSLPGGHMDVVKDPLALFAAEAIERVLNAG